MGWTHLLEKAYNGNLFKTNKIQWGMTLTVMELKGMHGFNGKRCYSRAFFPVKPIHFCEHKIRM